MADKGEVSAVASCEECGRTETGRGGEDRPEEAERRLRARLCWQGWAFLPEGRLRCPGCRPVPPEKQSNRCRDCGGHGSLREGTFLICPGCGGRGTADGQWPKGAA